MDKELWRKNLSTTHKGKILSDEHKEAIRKAGFKF